MRTQACSIPLIAVMLFTSVFFAAPAHADRGRKTGERALRSSQGNHRSGPSPSLRGNTSRPSRPSGALRGNGSRSSRSTGSSGPRLGNGEGLRALGRVLNNWEDGELGRRLDNYRYNNDRYDAAKEYADAYRDAAIANAVVGIVGILAQSAQPVRQPQYQQPTGRYEQRRVLIREGYFEESKVWVPEQFDSRNQVTVAGHYEIHRRWVPEVYGYQDVWVP